MTKKRKTKKVAEGMEVEATQGGFGEADISKPRVTEVVQDTQGHVEKLVVSKGVVFKKKVAIPADRVQAVDSKKGDQGKVTIETGPGEMEWSPTTHAIDNSYSEYQSFSVGYSP